MGHIKKMSLRLGFLENGSKVKKIEPVFTTVIFL